MISQTRLRPYRWFPDWQGMGGYGFPFVPVPKQKALGRSLLSDKKFAPTQQLFSDEPKLVVSIDTIAFGTVLRKPLTVSDPVLTVSNVCRII